MKPNVIKEYLTRLSEDSRITVWHLATFHALIHLWMQHNEISPFPISRKKIMENAHIKSNTTYHKCIKDLQLFNYIRYHPSYHPLLGSTVWFVQL